MATDSSGLKIRQAFVAPDGAYSYEFDYSQLETYCLAALAEDSVLVQELKAGADFHTLNAAFWKGKGPEEVTKAERRGAKSITFAMAYGAGALSIAERTGMSREEVQRFIDRFYAKYQGVAMWHENLVRWAQEQGYPVDLKVDGFPIKEFKLQYPYGKAYTFREEVRHFRGRTETSFRPTFLKNYPVQGIASDIIRMALAQIVRRRREIFSASFRPTNTVHDSNKFIGLGDVTEQVRKVKDIMENYPVKRLRELGFNWPDGLSLKVDVERGKNWLDTEKVSVVQ